VVEFEGFINTVKKKKKKRERRKRKIENLTEQRKSILFHKIIQDN